jgi:hypothetical protein
VVRLHSRCLERSTLVAAARGSESTRKVGQVNGPGETPTQRAVSEYRAVRVIIVDVCRAARECVGAARYPVRLRLTEWGCADRRGCRRSGP